MSARDVLLGREALASSPISSLQAVLPCCNFELPEPRPGCLQEPYPEPFLGSESVNRTAQNLNVRTKNSSIRFFFLSHFVTWKKVVKLHIYLKSAPGHT